MWSLCGVVLMLLVCAQAGAPVREQRDLSGAELTRLYNTRVIKAERFVRLKNGMPAWVPHLYITTHSGVRVTLADGNRRRYLIHKGPGFGSASDTVVTDAKYMSSAWKETPLFSRGRLGDISVTSGNSSLQLVSRPEKGDDTLCFRGAVTVGDLVKAGGEQYSLWRLQYCHTATNDMINMC